MIAQVLLRMGDGRELVIEGASVELQLHIDVRDPDLLPDVTVYIPRAEIFTGDLP